MEKIKILELFSGYGGASFALAKANIPYECVGYSDIDKCANYIYDLNHKGKALGDITKINAEDLEDFDLCTFGFPCTDVSIAGSRDLSKGRTNLFFEAMRIIKIKKPRWLLAENVEGILSINKGKFMKKVLNEFRLAGYTVKWKKLYSKDFGTPQNRPRIWFICFRDIEDANKFIFPEPEPLKLTVKDLLEEQVDKKYYLINKQLQRLNEPKNNNFKHPQEQNISKPIRTLTFHMSKDKLDVPYFDENMIYNLAHTKANGKRYKNDGCSFTLEAVKSQSICIADFRYDEGVRPRKNGIAPTLNLSQIPIVMSLQKRSINRPSMQKAIKDNKPLPGGYGTLFKKDGVAFTVDTNNTQAVLNHKRWRRLTPRECFRLQGFFNDEIKFGNLLDSKLYFLAGNGWDINVASKIFVQMFKGNKTSQKSLFEF